jgi:hypothetical protein
MQRTLQLQHGEHVTSKTAGRYVDITSSFSGPPRPLAAFLVCEPSQAQAPGALCASPLRAIRATSVNKNNVSGWAAEHWLTLNNKRLWN